MAHRQVDTSHNVEDERPHGYFAKDWRETHVIPCNLVPNKDFDAMLVVMSSVPARWPVQRKRRRLIISVIICAVSGLAAGCQGEYRGQALSPSAQKVVLYTIDGPYGEEFTRMLAAEIPAACGGKVAVVLADSVSQLANLGHGDSPCSYIRDLGAQAYITGKIRRSEQVYVAQYCVMGTFEIYDPGREGEIGAVPDATYVGDVDFGVNWAQGKRGPEIAQKVHQALAWWVARQIAKGLGY